MHPLLTQRRSGLTELCRRYGVHRLDAFGSAVRPAFDLRGRS